MNKMSTRSFDIFSVSSIFESRAYRDGTEFTKALTIPYNVFLFKTLDQKQ